MVSHRQCAMPVDAGETPEPTVQSGWEKVRQIPVMVLSLLIHMLFVYVLFALHLTLHSEKCVVCVSLPRCSLASIGVF
jgi:hypothetical protein